MIKKKMSLNDKALDANGKDRSCKNCNHRPCPEALANVCRDAFIKGYKRGYQQASDEYERIALDKGWASYPESKYKKNLKEHQAIRERYEKLYNYKEKEDKDVQD